MSRPRERSSNINAKRRCYIELEFISYHSRDDITRVLYPYPEVRLQREHGPNHWEVNLDPEKVARDDINTDIYTSDALIEYWEKVISALRQVECRESAITGYHIHVDVADLNPIQISNIYTKFYEYQYIMQLTIPKSRWENNVNCKPITANMADNMYDSALAWKQGRLSTEEFYDNVAGWKFYGISTNHIRDYQTLEFRWPSFTVDTDKLGYTLLLYRNLVDYFGNRYKGLQPVAQNPMFRLSTQEHFTDGHRTDYAKRNRHTKGPRLSKNLWHSWRQIYEYAAENLDQCRYWESRTKRLGNHGIGRGESCLINGITREIRTRYAK